MWLSHNSTSFSLWSLAPLTFISKAGSECETLEMFNPTGGGQQQLNNAPASWVNKLKGPCVHPCVSWKCIFVSGYLYSSQHIFSLWTKSSIFVLYRHKAFPQKALGLSMWVALAFSWAWRCWFWSRVFFIVLQPLVNGDLKVSTLWTVMLVEMPS